MSDVKYPDWHTRCDWCGWPLKDTTEHGCVIDNCSMRPLPQMNERQQYLFGIKRQCRKAEAELKRVETERDELQNQLRVACKQYKESMGALHAERDAALADAERYRWLRDGYDGHRTRSRAVYVSNAAGIHVKLDAAIDAARGEKG